METAPLDLEVAEAPKNGASFWVRASDGVRLRVGLWLSKETELGTVFVFPGRTEYIEKYGRTITQLNSLGFSTLVVDWRGQGLADRIAEDPMLGHVARFADYQLDVAAMLDNALELDPPKPWSLLGHSLGACIGLRALADGFPVTSCAFTGPMWNIRLPLIKRVAAWPVTWAAKTAGFGDVYAPGTGGTSYVLSTDFEENRLTSDPSMYRFFVNQARTLTGHQIGGPSMAWLFETLRETKALSDLPSPRVPCITFCGVNDVVVDISSIRSRMTEWPDGRLELIGDGKHDLLSELPEVRGRVFDKLASHFAP